MIWRCYPDASHWLRAARMIDSHIKTSIVDHPAIEPARVFPLMSNWQRPRGKIQQSVDAGNGQRYSEELPPQEAFVLFPQLQIKSNCCGSHPLYDNNDRPEQEWMPLVNCRNRHFHVNDRQVRIEMVGKAILVSVAALSTKGGSNYMLKDSLMSSRLNIIEPSVATSGTLVGSSSTKNTLGLLAGLEDAFGNDAAADSEASLARMDSRALRSSSVRSFTRLI